MAKPKLRAIVGARTSTFSDKKVFHEARLETARKWAESNGCNLVGPFEDLGVSASVAPEDRPDLGQWLTPERSAEWDCIVFSKMDRAFRSTRHCVDFARWAEENKRLVVFAEDGLKLDYRPGAAKGIDAMLAELFVYIGSFFAQMELNRFQTRAQDMHRVLRGTYRWASGVPPLGFQTVHQLSGRENTRHRSRREKAARADGSKASGRLVLHPYRRLAQRTTHTNQHGSSQDREGQGALRQPLECGSLYG